MLNVSIKNMNSVTLADVLEDLEAHNLISNSVEPEMFCTDKYNCWGFTAYALGWDDNLDWYGNADMEEHLCINSFEVESPRVGDIVVFRDLGSRELIHTAILISSDGVIVHKPGDQQLALSIIKKTQRYYTRYCDSGKCGVTYCRPGFFLPEMQRELDF